MVFQFGEKRQVELSMLSIYKIKSSENVLGFEVKIMRRSFLLIHVIDLTQSIYFRGNILVKESYSVLPSFE